MPFNVWWQERQETGVMSHLLHHRSRAQALQECVTEQLKSLELVEAKAQDALQAVFAEMANSTGSEVTVALPPPSPTVGAVAGRAGGGTEAPDSEQDPPVATSGEEERAASS